jgi:hypothetical protein
VLLLLLLRRRRRWRRLLLLLWWPLLLRLLPLFRPLLWVMWCKRHALLPLQPTSRQLLRRLLLLREGPTAGPLQPSSCCSIVRCR